MELLNKYITELDSDLKVDLFNIKDVQLKLPAVKHKWVGRCTRHKIELNQLSIKRDKLKKELITGVLQQSPVKLTEGVAERTVEKSAELLSFDTQAQDLKLVIEFLEKTEKTLSSMTYDIKNMVELIKLETT